MQEQGALGEIAHCATNSQGRDVLMEGREMKIEVLTVNEWKYETWKKWRTIHWFAIIACFEPLYHFNPLLELHIWIFNFLIRITFMKKMK